MIISDMLVSLLRAKAAKELARNIHPEDAIVYARGLEDGTTMLAGWVIDQLKEEESE
jgi:hypothetical protein